MPDTMICREHSGVCQEIRDVARNVADHEARIRSGQELMSDLRGDMRAMKVLIVIAILASFLGGAVGPEIWKALGLIH